MKRLLIIAALAALVAAYFFFGLGDYLTVEGIKQVAGDVGAYYERNPAQVIAGFFLVYVAVAAASLPGAAVMRSATSFCNMRCMSQMAARCVRRWNISGVEML